MKKWQKDLAQQFDHDGMDALSSASLTHEEQEYLSTLQRLRDGVQEIKTTPEITDAQFSAFMSGIREGIEARPTGYRGLWAAVSMVTAALVIAFSLFAVLDTFHQRGKLPAVQAEVEKATTEIQGATVNSYTSDDGTAVVWVNDATVDRVNLW
ncbi:MAG: hypothetical protein AMXMBFR4_27570 [Candidatus Hydrogenedentota bacterium]